VVGIVISGGGRIDGRGCFLFFFLPPLLSFFFLKFVGGLRGLCGNHGGLQ
jgi:hypothetical protein